MVTNLFLRNQTDALLRELIGIEMLHSHTVQVAATDDKNLPTFPRIKNLLFVLPYRIEKKNPVDRSTGFFS